MIHYLPPDLALDVAEVELFGGPPAVRDLGLLDSALYRPQASMFGEEAYPSMEAKAAAMLDSLVRNHALVDGNKRLSLTLTATFLGLNGFYLDASHDEMFDLVVRLADVGIGLDDLTAMLAGWMAPLSE